MIKTINLGEREESIEALKILKKDNKTSRDIQIINSHITNLNELIGERLIKNSRLYIGSQTLFEIMQEGTGKGQHNYHNLTADDVYLSLISIKDPKCVFTVNGGRFALISIELSHFDKPLMVVIETESGLIENKTASVSKIVTIYPRGNIDKYLEKIDQRLLLYMKK